MNEMLRTILDMDKAAQLKVEEAEEYRRKAIADIGAKKAAIVEDETKKAKESAAKRSEKRKTEGKALLTEIQNNNEKILNKMNSLYEKNADKWVNDIVRSVTE